MAPRGRFVTDIWPPVLPNLYLTPTPPLHTDTLCPITDGGVLGWGGGSRRGRSSAVKSAPSPDQASACLVMCCHWPIRESRSNRRRQRPLAAPSLSTPLFLIEHICGMRGFSLEGPMAADTSKLLTQDQAAQQGYQTICWHIKKYSLMSHASERSPMQVCGEERIVFRGWAMGEFGHKLIK